MPSLDDLLDRRYDYHDYNCGHFVAEAWKILTGECIANICRDFVSGDTGANLRNAKLREKLHSPQSPCVVFMQAPRVPPHAGIYIDGRVLHLTEQGAQVQDIAILSIYHRLSYFK